MSGDLAAEEAALLPHPALEEGVADAVHQRRARRSRATVSLTAWLARTS